MLDDIEKLRGELYKLISNNNPLYKGEILKVSQELDRLINLYYFSKKIKEGDLASGF